LRAIRAEGGEPRLVTDAPEPSPGPGEALVRPTCLAVDADDGRSEHEGVLGHEFVGVVESVASPAGSSWAQGLPGRRVVGNAHVPCGSCERCRAGLSLHCARATVLGLRGRDGCFAERFVLPASSLTEVPKGLDDDRAVFAGTLGRVLHAARMVRLEGKTYVSVLGDGPLALLAAQVMARRNAAVRLLGEHESNLELCAKWGVKHRPQDEVGRRRDQDVVFECTGTGASIGLALALVRPRGSVVLMRHRSGAQIDAGELFGGELQVFGSRGCAVGEAVAELASGAVDVVSLIGRRLRFEDAPGAIRAAGEPGGLKVLLDGAA
jgi:alcohol dehydrogenase